MNTARCPWAESHPLLREYHDSEWGVPLHDEERHFEYLLLETMQAGLSWLTVLKKRSAFREAFADFDPERIARFGDTDIDRLMDNAGIIRYRRKLTAAVTNARAFLEVRREFGSFDRFLWSFAPDGPIDHAIEDQTKTPTQTPLAVELAGALKRRGFTFLGPVTVYAHLQAVGVVNDHLTGCFRYSQLHRE